MGVSFATAAISQTLRDQLIPNGTIPIAAFETKATTTDLRVNSTSATFVESGGTSGYIIFF